MKFNSIFLLTEMIQKRKEDFQASMDQLQNYKFSLAKMEFYNPDEEREGLIFFNYLYLTFLSKKLLFHVFNTLFIFIFVVSQEMT
jgi:hypothetical protein